MQKAFFFLLLVVFATAQVDDWHTCADSIVKFQQDLINFGASVEEQIKGTFIPDVQKIVEECKHAGEVDDWASCATAIIKFGESIVAFGQEVENTIKSVIIPDVMAIKNNCKKAEDFDDINDWTQCMEDVGKIVELAGKIASDIKKFDFTDLVSDVQQLYALVQQAIKDCSSGEVMLQQSEQTWPACLADIVKLLKELTAAIADIKSFKIVKAIQDIKEIIATIKEATADCKLKINLQLDEAPQSWEQCVEDVGKIVQVVPTIIDDIKKGDFAKLVTDVQELYQLVQTAITDCSQSRLSQDENQDWMKCISDVSKLVEFVPTIIDDIKQKNFPKLIQDVQTLIPMVKSAITDCIPHKLEQDEALMMPNDWTQCMEDVGKIVELAGKIASDIKKFDFTDLVSDVQQLYSLVQQAIKDCAQ